MCDGMLARVGDAIHGDDGKLRSGVDALEAVCSGLCGMKLSCEMMRFAGRGDFVLDILEGEIGEAGLPPAVGDISCFIWRDHSMSLAYDDVLDAFRSQ